MIEISTPQLIPLPEVVKITGISKSEIFRRMKESRFPIPVRLGTGRCTRWERSEIVGWVNARLAERDTKRVAAPAANALSLAQRRRARGATAALSATPARED